MTSARIQSRAGQLVLPEAAVFQAYAVATISLTTSFVEQAIFTSVSINREIILIQAQVDLQHLVLEFISLVLQ